MELDNPLAMMGKVDGWEDSSEGGNPWLVISTADTIPAAGPIRDSNEEKRIAGLENDGEIKRLPNREREKYEKRTGKQNFDRWYVYSRSPARVSIFSILVISVSFVLHCTQSP